MRIGRVANEVARLIMGKHKPFYTPNVLCGDYVVVKNCQRMTFSGRKWEQKSYRWHTGWPSGLRKVYAQDMLQRQPDELLRHAVLGMLPHNKMRIRRMGLLRIYVGDDSPH